MKYLGLDIGEKTVGVAESDSGIVASPMEALEMGADFMQLLGSVIETEKPDVIVFGIPRHQDGSENSFAKDIRKLAEGVHHEFDIKVDFADEYGTTKEAEERLRRAGVDERDLKKYDDSMAAVIILENYFPASSE